MKRIVLLFVTLLGLSLNGMSQQQYVFTNFLLNDYYYNPAIAGSKEGHVANLAYRNQWTGFEDAPVTLIGNVYGSYKDRGKHGYGLSVISDRTGLTQNTGFYLNYAHHFKLNDELTLGLGVRTGYVQYRVRLYDARLADDGDDVLTGNILSANAWDMHSGFHLYSKDYFVMGGMQHMLGDGIEFTTYNSSLARHYTLIGGYNYKVKSKDLVLQPSLMLKYTNPVPVQLTFMAKATYQDKYWAGLLYRTQDALGICLGYQLKERLTIGYGFDYSLSGIQNYQSGSHELVFSYILTRRKPSLDEQDEKLNNSILERMNQNNLP